MGSDYPHSLQYGSTCLHWAVKGFVQNKDQRGYNSDDYVIIVKLLLSISPKLLKMKNKVASHVPGTSDSPYFFC